MSARARLGDPIPVYLQLHTGDTVKFVRAHLRDASGTPLGGSPASLPHVANGMYVNLSFSMPNTPFVTITYEVFDDAGFTVPSSFDGDGEDSYVFDASDVGGGGGTASSALACRIGGRLREPGRFVGLLPDPRIIGLVRNEARVAGLLSSVTIVGKVVQETIEGEL